MHGRRSGARDVVARMPATFISRLFLFVSVSGAVWEALAKSLPDQGAFGKITIWGGGRSTMTRWEWLLRVECPLLSPFAGLHARQIGNLTKKRIGPDNMEGKAKVVMCAAAPSPPTHVGPTGCVHLSNKVHLP